MRPTGQVEYHPITAANQSEGYLDSAGGWHTRPRPMRLDIGRLLVQGLFCTLIAGGLVWAMREH